MEIHNGGNFHYSDYKITTYSFWPNNSLLAIFKVTEAILSIFNPKYLIAKIVITLIHALPSINTPHNIVPLHCTSMIGSHSRSTAMAFKGVRTFRTLGVNNPFLNSFQVNDTITTNYPMMIFASYDPTSFTIK
jgi:hypothetical protein